MYTVFAIKFTGDDGLPVIVRMTCKGNGEYTCYEYTVTKGITQIICDHATRFDAMFAAVEYFGFAANTLDIESNRAKLQEIESFYNR